MTPVPSVHPAERILMGPGPSPVPQRVLRALSAPTLGHLDPQYLAIMDDTCEMLRQIFRTKNALTFPVSGTGMAGMECIATNLLEPGDEAIVGVNGVFGTRMKDVMERCGATVHAVEATWGETITRDQITAALEVNEPPSVVVPQGMVGVGRICPDAEFHFVSVRFLTPQTHQGFELGTRPARTSPQA